MANATYEVQANDATSEASVARVDMKFEIVVMRSRVTPSTKYDREARWCSWAGRAAVANASDWEWCRQ